MSGLALKRLVVILLSQALGIVLAYLLIGVGFDLLSALLQNPAIYGISPATYGTIYFLATSIPIGLMVMIWMDAFLDTKILPD
jgi:hypothetical protein